MLLLELGYQTQSTKENNGKITSDVQKLIAWLHGIGQNDACAERAYWVLQRILQDVAPFFRSKADEMLTAGAASGIADDQSPSTLVSPYPRHNPTVSWAQDEFLGGPEPVTGHHKYSSPLDQNYQDPMLMSGNYLPQNSMSFSGIYTSNTVGNPFINSWDDDQPLSGLQNFWPYPQPAPADPPEGTGSEYPGSQSDSQQQYQH